MANILSADVYDEGDSNLRPESRRIEDTGALFTGSQTATSYIVKLPLLVERVF